MDTNLIKTYNQYAKLGNVNKLSLLIGNQVVRAIRSAIIDLHIVGNIPREPSIFVHYHTTSIDAPLMSQYLDSQNHRVHGLMSSRSFERMPVFNSLFGEIPFDASITKKSQFKWSMDEVDYWLGRGHSILLSNDGQTDRHDGKKLEEKIVSDLHARIAKRTGKQVIPISPYVYLPEKIYLWQGKTTWKELARRWRMDYFLGFSEPINPLDYETSRELAEETKRRQISMQDILKEKENKHREGTYSWLKQFLSHFG